MTAPVENQSAAYNIQTDYQTLTKHFLQEQQQLGPKATGDFTILLNAIQFTCKVIAHNIRRANLLSLGGLAGASNATGDEQKKLDIISNDIFLDAMKACGRVSVIVSEEEEEAIIVEGANGKYCVACDPIDGSSNLDAGVSVGTIFGIYKCKEGSSGSVKDVLRPGTEMMVAGYCMYAASANLIITTGKGLNGFTLDSALGEFILTHPNMKIPKSRAIYSVNEGNSMYWDEPCKKYFESLKFPESGKPYSARYIGSMVADVHRTLLYGGIFAYPADSKSKKGKLRVLYECFPMAMITEQAGGIATDGKTRILDLCPSEIHERSGIFLGSENEVNKLLQFYAEHSS